MPMDQRKICYMMPKYDSEPAFIPFDRCKTTRTAVSFTYPIIVCDVHISYLVNKVPHRVNVPTASCRE